MYAQTSSDHTTTGSDKTSINVPRVGTSLRNPWYQIAALLRLQALYDQLHHLTNRLCLILPFQYSGGAVKYINIADSSIWRLIGLTPYKVRLLLQFDCSD